MKVDRKLYGSVWKYILKCMKVYESVWKCMKVYEVYRKVHEGVL